MGFFCKKCRLSAGRRPGNFIEKNNRSFPITKAAPRIKARLDIFSPSRIDAQNKCVTQAPYNLPNPANTTFAIIRNKGSFLYESNRNRATHRRAWQSRHTKGDPPHNENTRRRPDADNIDTRCSILVCSDGFIQENWTELKKTT